MSFAHVTVLVRHAISFTLSTAASPALTTLGAQSLATRLSTSAGVDVFAPDYDVILAAMYALTVSAEGDCYLCMPPDPDIEAAALVTSESALPGTAPVEALHTFTLDSGASRCLFRDSNTLTPLLALVPVRLADLSGGHVLARSSNVLPCLAVLSWSLSGFHLPSFSTNLVNTAALQDAMVTTTTPRSLRVSICTCTRTGRHLATFTRRPGSNLYTLTTKPPQVAASARVSASGPVSASPPALACPALPSLRRGAAARSTSLLLVSPDDYSFRLQLRERFHYDFLVLRLHSGRGGEFSSDLLRDFCRGVGILQLFTLPASSQQNGVAERRIGLVMEMAAQPLAPCLLVGTSPTLRWTGKVGDASVFRVCGARVFVRDISADKLSSRTIPCVFLGFLPDAPGWQFYHPTSRRVFPSHDVTFDESVSFLPSLPLPHCPSSPPPPLFLTLGPPLVDPFPPQGPAPSGVSQVDPIPLAQSVEVTVESGAAEVGAVRGAAFGGAKPAGVEPGGAEPASAEPGGAEYEGAESGGAEPRGIASGAARAGGTGAGGAEATNTGGSGVTAGAGGTGGAGAASLGGARIRGTRAGDPRAGGTGPRDPGAGGIRARGDLVFATADTKALALVKSELQKRHTHTDLCELRSYLGLQITRDRARRTISQTQSHMVHQVFQRFGFRHSSPQSTPLPTGHSLSAPLLDDSVEPSGPYPELVGCLMYPMTCTRPDIAYTLSILARYVAPRRHRLEHWEAAKKVLHYLCSTSDMWLVLGGRGLVFLTGHADASWVDNLATQRSSQGYIFSLDSGSVS
ncbi:unnamed protein product [Closterium sp. NIES-54]